MSPENQWLEGVYIPYWNSPFLGDEFVSFGGCNLTDAGYHPMVSWGPVTGPSRSHSDSKAPKIYVSLVVEPCYQPIRKICVEMGIFFYFRGENNKSLKPPPRIYLNFVLQCLHLAIKQWWLMMCAIHILQYFRKHTFSDQLWIEFLNSNIWKKISSEIFLK